ncbi:MAG TPA: FAD-dependent oxidoreductase [Planctomycetes bacterium]|nr:FAD-dependent oxidoreductase [Planctomycetota bacterium]
MVDLPMFGRPTMPQATLMGRGGVELGGQERKRGGHSTAGRPQAIQSQGSAGFRPRCAVGCGARLASSDSRPGSQAPHGTQRRQSSEASAVKTAILGAGISGLALARFMLEGGHPASGVHLFEAAPVAGGLCRSKTVEGFTYDISGGHILFSKDAKAQAWMKQNAGGDKAFVERKRQTKIRFEDRWVHYPFENGLGDLPQEANFDCLKGYIEAWHGRQEKDSQAPREFGAWVRWRFGEGIARHFMDPYNEKVWKRDLARLSSDWVAGRVPDAPLEDVLKAALGLRSEGYTHQSVFHYPRQGGFQAITDGLAAQLGQSVRYGTPVTALQRVGHNWKVNGEAFDCVVSTLPLTSLPNIVEDLPADVAVAMGGLEFNSVLCFLLALNRPKHPDLSWIYLPHASQGPANRVTYMSNYAENNAPEGQTSFLCEVTFDGAGPPLDASCESEVIDGLVHAGVLKREEILFSDHSISRHAYVVFDHDYHARRELALGWLDANGICALGRFGRFEYDNSDMCVIKSRELAAKLLDRAAQG